VNLRFEEAAAMRVSPAFVAALLLLLAAPAGAAVFEIPLPELAGTYGPDSANGRTAKFHLPGVEALIYSASLRVRGTTEVGIIRCPGGDYPWVTVTQGEMLAGPDQFWLSEAANPPVAGAFETITPFVFVSIHHLPASWTFLADGEGSIGFYGAPIGRVLLDCVDLNPPSVTVTEATLIFDADFPVPTKVRTWGRVKAAYR
jgi:hypothetical protein